MIEYYDVTVRVRYAETDQMGVVYHSNFLIWFEVGRVEIMRSLGFDYKRMELEDDCYLVVADAHCRYHQTLNRPGPPRRKGNGSFLRFKQQRMHELQVPGTLMHPSGV